MATPEQGRIQRRFAAVLASRMGRREFIALMACAAAAWPLVAHAQQPDRVRRVGVLMGVANDPEGQARVAAFRQALQTLGWTEDRNVQIDYRWAAGDVDRMRTFAAELAGLTPDVMLVNTTAALVALAQETHSIPIVFAQAADPVSIGLAAGLGQPGGNITGFTAVEYTLGGKWLEMLKKIAPSATDVVVIHNPDDPSAPGYLRATESAARSLGVRLTMAGVRDAAEIKQAIDTFARKRSAGLIVLPSAVTTVHHERIVALAAKHRLPAVYPYRFYSVSGGLMSYGFDNIDLYRRAASYVDRILRGAKPSELPIQQPTKFELVINLKAARALGLEVPPTLLAQADEVIE